MHLVNYVGEVLEQCDICRSFEKAPQVRIAETSTVCTLNGKLHLDPLFLDNLIAFRVMDVPSRYTPLISVHPKVPQKCAMPFAARGLGFLADRSVSRWMEAGGRTIVWKGKCGARGLSSGREN